MQEISTDAAPEALGPYSQGIVDGNTIYVAGQGPVNPEAGQIESDDITDQTVQSLRNSAAILESADSSLNDVVKTTVFLTDLADYDGFNEGYQKMFDKPYPARSTVGVADLIRDGMRVEIEVIAIR